MEKDFILGADDPKHRELKIIKTCEVCCQRYHPRKNGYEATSRFCSQKCTKEGRRGQQVF